MSDEPKAPILLDNVVLSNFLLADAMPVLLDTIHDRGRLTSEVLDENIAGRRAGHRALEALDRFIEPEQGPSLRLVHLTAAERRNYSELIRALGRGEASAIAVAVARGFVFASDDRVARAAAQRLRIPLTGTIGLLLAATRDHVCSADEADQMLAKMLAAGYRAPLRSIRGLTRGGQAPGQ